MMTTQTEPTNLTPVWSTARRVFFRFVCAYLVVYFPVIIIDNAYFTAYGPETAAWNVVAWVGKQIFQVTITVGPHGFGDTTYKYVEVFCLLVLAVAATGVWTLLDRKRLNYSRLHEWLRAYVRFWLVPIMIYFGGAKVIPSQFPPASLDRLVQPLGQFSPMGLLWAFMGASAGYTVFTGVAEMLGGLLLSTRRTTLLGALVCIVVLSNVVMLNFCYDNGGKLVSLHLLAMAVFLILADLPRLGNLLVFNRRAEPAECPALFGRRWVHRGVLVLRTTLVVALAGLSLYAAFQQEKMFGGVGAKSPLYGIWNVEELSIAGQVRPPVLTDETRWRRVILDYPGMIAIQLTDDSCQRYLLSLDPDKKTLGLSRPNNRNWKSTLSFQQPEPDRLILEGMFEGRPVVAKMRRFDKADFLLVNRGFHWINEYPFNP